jgi:hypothetical protein
MWDVLRYGGGGGGGGGGVGRGGWGGGRGLARSHCISGGRLGHGFIMGNTYISYLQLCTRIGLLFKLRSILW